MSNDNKPKSGRFETEDIKIEGDKPLSLGEIRDTANAGGIEVEQVTGVNASADALALEAFMSEIMVIRVAEDNDEEALAIITINVNGISQPIMRGVSTPVKRKYVEAMARAKETRYRQSLADPSDPASIVMIPRTALAYPFSVERDDNPNGRAWLRDLLAQPA